MDPMDVNALLSIPCDEMTIVHDAIDNFVSWPKKLITLDTLVCLSKLKYKSKF